MAFQILRCLRCGLDISTESDEFSRSVSYLQVAAVPFIWHDFLANPIHQLPFYQQFQPEGFRDLRESAKIVRGDDQNNFSPDTVRSEVLQTVQRVLGAVVSETAPLIQAGLDSLGK